jgi:hypothetical protein
MSPVLLIAGFQHDWSLESNNGMAGTAYRIAEWSFGGVPVYGGDKTSRGSKLTTKSTVI